MYDDDMDALAAEYVLGTLSAEERNHAEGLLLIDPGFEAAVRQWERRLGELNVMVEAVEPRAELWKNIKAEIGTDKSGDEAELPRVEEAALQAPEGLAAPEALEAVETPEESEALQAPEASEASEAEGAEETEETGAGEAAEEAPEAAEEAPEPGSPLAALELSLLAPPEPEPETPAEAAADQPAAASPSWRGEPKAIERSADVVYLAGRLKRWRRMTLVLGALAALLALYVAVWQAAPNLIPAELRPAGAGMLARAPAPGRLPQDRLVAVLQQEPMSPAFLLTLDTRDRRLIVRNVSATPEAGRSYELWLIAKQLPNPRSLGLVGDGEFTQRALPANYDVATLRAASYAVSLEPAGGSPSGVPTGPILFTGKAVESLPASPPAPPKT